MYKICQVTQPLFAGMAIPTPFLAIFTDNPEKALVYIGCGIVCALLSLVSTVAAHDEK